MIQKQWREREKREKKMGEDKKKEDFGEELQKKKKFQRFFASPS